MVVTELKALPLRLYLDGWRLVAITFSFRS